jgi:hypothetical protein
VRVDPRVGLFIMEGDTLTRQFVEFERSAFNCFITLRPRLRLYSYGNNFLPKMPTFPNFYIWFPLSSGWQMYIIIKFLGNDRLKEVLF